MYKLIHFINSINRRLGEAIRYLLFGMLGLTLMEVILRWVFNSPTLWSYELMQYLFGTWVFLGGGYTLLRKGHVAMDAVYNRVLPKRRVKFTLDTMAFIIITLFCSFLVWQGTEVAWESIRIREPSITLWAPPLYPFKSIIPIGGFLLGLQGIAKFLEDIISFRANKGVK